MIINRQQAEGYRRGLGLSALMLFAGACMSTNLPPISSYSQGFEPLKDERFLWQEARGEEALLLDNTTLYADPGLESYLQGIVARLSPPSMAGGSAIEYRVRVIEDPSLNAFAYPHGSIYLHTGLLSRMRNEDQLATVLAHEMTHVENRHAVRHRRSAHNKRMGWGLAAVAASVILAEKEWDAYSDGAWGRGIRIGILGDLFIGLGLQLAVQASVQGYGRDLEREADDGGLAKLGAAGYDLAEAPKAYRALLEDEDGDSVPGVFFFASHPKLTRRVQNAEAWLARHPEQEIRQKDEDAFRQQTAPILLIDAHHRLAEGKLDLAAEQVARVLETLPQSAEAHRLLERVLLARQASRGASP